MSSNRIALIAVLVLSLTPAAPNGELGEARNGQPQSQPQQSLTIGDSVTCAGCVIELALVRSVGSPDDPVLLDAFPSPVMDSNGNIVALGAGATTVVIFDSSGTQVASFGRVGQGPGEFPSAGPILSVGVEDSVYAFSNGRVSVFPPRSREPARTAQLQISSPIGGLVLSNGKMVLQATGARSRAYPALVFEPNGARVGQVGRIALDATQTCQECRYYAVGASRGAEGVWLLPGFGYRLESWSLDGTLRARINVESKWFHEWNPATRDPVRPNTRTLLSGVREDTRGLIWIRASVPEREGGSSLEPERNLGTGFTSVRRSSTTLGFDPRYGRATIFEVLDPQRGVIVARRTFESLWLDFLGDDLVYSRRVNDSGVVSIDIWRLTLSIPRSKTFP